MPKEAQIRAGSESGHTDVPSPFEKAVADGDYVMPFMTQEDGVVTVRFVTKSGIGSYVGVGPDWKTAFRNAIANGAELVPTKEQIDAAVEGDV